MMTLTNGPVTGTRSRPRAGPSCVAVDVDQVLQRVDRDPLLRVDGRHEELLLLDELVPDGIEVAFVPRQLVDAVGIEDLDARAVDVGDLRAIHLGHDGAVVPDVIAFEPG